MFALLFRFRVFTLHASRIILGFFLGCFAQLLAVFRFHDMHQVVITFCVQWLIVLFVCMLCRFQKSKIGDKGGGLIGL